ncbi:gamma-glutamylcyclotransferase family protein [Pseudonocardia bannensis]|uniref:Gamma-glutamylcyclotransferase n=1 Tax=Pseudonocardia bannensis TaxID=630973 RepID=A0A848DPW4_9PSEU|nr:gamma-glutamylcyclotransferase family protein [Pseudonocardia bannensis]NMH94890.1 gamma-glutamylcyclotransferase [Pseudonocardia bannensis]
MLRARLSVTYPDGDFPANPANPYPGAVPPTSFVHVDGAGRALQPDPAALAGWRVDGTDLDDWLASRAAAPLAARVPVLTYGSNRNPSKISWLRRNLGLAGPVVVLWARTEDLAAVWAYGLRVRDDQRPAVLATAPGAAEDHAVWLATPEQVAMLDICEGRGGRYRLARLRSGIVRTEDGARVENPWCYLGNTTIRRPLLVDGGTVRCAATTQADARTLDGRPADGDGLDAVTVHGAPHPDGWPAAVFVYGLLQPGQPSWHLVAPHIAGPPRRAVASGTVFDTRRGYPALRPGAGHGAPGWVVPVRDPAALLPALDAYEGPEYRRIRITVTDGTVCWAYAWSSPLHGLVPLPSGWPA